MFVSAFKCVNKGSAERGANVETALDATSSFVRALQEEREDRSVIVLCDRFNSCSCFIPDNAERSCTRLLLRSSLTRDDAFCIGVILLISQLISDNSFNRGSAAISARLSLSTVVPDMES